MMNRSSDTLDMSVSVPAKPSYRQPGLRSALSAGGRSDVIPTDLAELEANYRSYIVGGLRNQGVSHEDLDDKLQDVFLHCLASNFFLRVKEKVDAGLMNPKQFRAYLATTIHNVLVNEYKKDARDPATSATTTDAQTDMDGGGMLGVNLSRHLDPDDEGRDCSIPLKVLEDDIIRYVAEHKPSFVPTLILWLDGHRPSDIARIIGKKKETIHYRMKAIFELLEGYFTGHGGNTARPAGGEGERSSPHEQGIVVGKTYRLVGENPFKRGSLDELYKYVRTLCTIRGVTMAELVNAASRLMEQGKFVSKSTAKDVVKIFLANAKEKGVLEETEVEVKTYLNQMKAARRCTYIVTSTENPYKRQSGAGYIIFEGIKSYPSVDLATIISVVQANIDAGVIHSKRAPEDIGWGFIETSRGYRVLKRSDG